MKGKINFLEKGAFVLTYKKMLTIGILWVAFCIGVFFIEGSYSWILGRSIETQKIELKRLNIMKERAMALVEASKTKDTAPDAKELSEVYAHFPLWSSVMGALSRSMPPQLWLTSVSSEYLTENSMMRKIEIGGVARNTASIASFIKQLNDKPVFQNMVLNKSNRVEEEGSAQGFSFVLLGEVKFEGKKWD